MTPEPTPPRATTDGTVGPDAPNPGYPALCCPVCRTELHLEGEPVDGTYVCKAEDRRFPIVCGIPDLRLVPDRYLSFAQDRAKALRLDSLGVGFAETVSAYWEMTPEVPPGLAASFMRNAAAGVQRARPYVDALGVIGPGDVLLDVGCGTGGLLALAASRGARVVGIDTALRWLVIARHFLAERGVSALLVAADGAAPPFRSGSFSAVTCIETLEHAREQRPLVQNVLDQARQPGGRSLLVTANRFSIAREPAVDLWGVGWLPRSKAAAYVHARRSTSYDYTRPVSLSELSAFVGPRSGVAFGAAPLPPALSNGGFSARLRTSVDIAFARLPALASVAPFIAIQSPAPTPAS